MLSTTAARRSIPARAGSTITVTNVATGESGASPRARARHLLTCSSTGRSGLFYSVVFGTGGENKAVEVDRLPAVAACGADCPTLFVAGWFDQDCLAVADAGGEEFPEAVSDAAAGIADEDACAGFDHPAG
ncbi:putative CRISPR-associated protein cas2 (plasmid) [Streptomyces sp. Tu6071]|nr:putative CRISPR-associated protein cas2 [Streptomyces sp. Tu6071]